MYRESLHNNLMNNTHNITSQNQTFQGLECASESARQGCVGIARMLACDQKVDPKNGVYVAKSTDPMTTLPVPTLGIHDKLYVKTYIQSNESRYHPRLYFCLEDQERSRYPYVHTYHSILEFVDFNVPFWKQ